MNCVNLTMNDAWKIFETEAHVCFYFANELIFLGGNIFGTLPTVGLCKIFCHEVALHCEERWNKNEYTCRYYESDMKGTLQK